MPLLCAIKGWDDMASFFYRVSPPNCGVKQVWSLSSFKVSRQLLTNDLNQVSSVSLLMTSSTALANEGLFELTRRPSLTRAVSSSFAETTEEPGCSQVKFA